MYIKRKKIGLGISNLNVKGKYKKISYIFEFDNMNLRIEKLKCNYIQNNTWSQPFCYLKTLFSDSLH